MRMGLACVGLIGLLCLAGCGPSKPKTVPVSGTVKIKGQPVEGVEVKFLTEKFAAFGKTNAEGKFQLAPGALPGRNKVALSKLDTGGVQLDPAAGMDAEMLKTMQESGGKQAKIKQLVPAEYTDPATTKLEFDVPAKGTTSADFDLK